MSHAADPHAETAEHEAHETHAVEPSDELAPDEPKTPLWLTALGGGLLRRGSRGQSLFQFDDPGRVRPLELTDVRPGGVPDEILELVRAGKTKQAIKRYRALNGATLDEAQTFIANL